ncbi:MAG TPA: hypothetical protein VIM33_06475 [Gaiellaceae bacterium]|jgi:hypothetical protein
MLQSTWHPSRRQLNAYARKHLDYEVTMTAALAVALPRLFAPNAPVTFEATVERNALLEAFLVHVRLLDDFLGDPRQAKPATARNFDDVFARHWVPSWQPKRVMTEVERKRANAQITHLSGRRRLGYRWKVPDLGQRCCTRMVSFIDAIEAHDSKLAEPLTPAATTCRNYLARPTGPAITPAAPPVGTTNPLSTATLWTPPVVSSS